MQAKCFERKILLFGLITALLLCLLAPSLAFASESGGGEHNDNRPGKGNIWYWANGSKSGNWDVSKPPKNGFGKIIKGLGKDYDQNFFGKDMYWTTYLVSAKKKAWVYNFSKVSANSDAAGNYSNKVGSGSTKGGVTFFNNSATKKILKDAGKPYSIGSTGKTGKSSGKDLSYIYINGHMITTTTTTDTSKEKLIIITHTSDDPDGSKKWFDDSKQTAEWKWKYGKTSGEYYGITDPGELNHKNNIKITCQKVIQTTHTKVVKKGDEIISTETTYTYSTGRKYRYNKLVTYKGNTPENGQHKFTPLNLNRNDYAIAGDGGLTNDYIGGHKIDATVDNKKGITDNTSLESLDINNDMTFAFRFNNNALGLPLEHDWTTAPKALGNGSWEWVNGTYANGRVGDKNCLGSAGMPNGTVGYYRFNTKFLASINIANNKTSSLVAPDNSEKVDSEIFSKTGDYRGGDWAARFIYNGEYTTDQDPSSSAWKQWWVDTYTQERYYEYGVEYKGTFDTSGISNPTQMRNYDSPRASLNGSAFTTDGLTQRGLYVGKVSTNYTQPVLYGHWYVKTLAGDVNGSGVNVR